ncbi:MAG: hypothetical protein AAFQ42_04985 [Pseudomonadota bacterium]
MADILTFTPREPDAGLQVRTASSGEASRAAEPSAEIIIFPGVRIERHLDADDVVAPAARGAVTSN